MSIRSEILIHWTGKHLSSETDESKIISGYLELIKSIYSDGLRYSRAEEDEVVLGAGGASSTIPKIPMICYTELRLSNVQEHTSRYGKMGIGFRRDWLMRHGANPVFYVQNRGEGVVNTNLAAIVPEVNGIPGLEVFLSFVKPMSAPSQESLTYYDEMEWRMVLWKAQSVNPPVQMPDPDWVRRDGPTAYFKFSPDDVAIIVTPDEKTRKAILADSEMKRHFASHLPMMVDADKCDQF
jgi:hypothetical protein